MTSSARAAPSHAPNDDGAAANVHAQLDVFG
jgi:hypothetical protein